ncbi:NAD-dependent epimerase/dehydratase family protein [Patescibacteria group bacterium]|nr:NAD-dependent epimerase/dehydratase family protein [Patescibacteria group bacterium]
MINTVVVTGGAGFVGSHLCERLVAAGHRVISLDNYFTGTIDNHVPGVEYREGHTKDIHTVIPETPQLVFHLGEYARTEKSFEDIEYVWDLNKTGTFAVLEFCRAKKCKLIYAGSSTKFADGGSGRDQSPYAWSKATNTELVQNYGQWFGLSYAITYFYNVYGPREMSGPFGTLIRIFSELYRAGQPLTVVLPGTQMRNFTHVNDIVSGLLLVGEKGSGDGYGIGADESFSVMEVARMFGGTILEMPERPGNRLTAGVDNAQVKALGWKQNHTLPVWIQEVKAAMGPRNTKPVRVLVFATTFYPKLGISESALSDLLQAFPAVHFDIITTAFASGTTGDLCPYDNATIHRVGVGNVFDKYLLPFLGLRAAEQLLRQHEYVFKWSLLASYGTLAAIFARSGKHTPLLITLADQRLDVVPWYFRALFRFMLGQADQVHVHDTASAKTTLALSRRGTLMRSIGEGDAFANQIRIAYTQFLRQQLYK